MKDTDPRPRLIEAGSCTWCGHRPHGATCGGSVRLGKDEPMAPCPCARPSKDSLF